MNKQTELLRNSLPLIGAGLGDKLGVRITVSGTGAWTDGTTINIPDFHITTKEQKSAVLGFMSHEAAHIKFDTFKGVDAYTLNKNPLRKTMWNIFEDLRIEKAMIEAMIGTQNWINQIWINRQADGREVITQDATPQQAISEYLLFKCRVQHRQQAHLQPYLDAAEEVFMYQFGWKLLTKLSAVLDTQLPTLNSSSDAYNLAVEVEQLIAHHEPEEEEPEQPDDEEQSSESEQSDSDSNDSDSNGGEQSDTGDNSGGGDESQEENSADQTEQGETSEGEQSPQDNGRENGQSDQGSASTQGGEPSSEEIKQAIQQLLDSGHSDFKDEMDDFAKSMEMLAQTNPSPNKVPMPDVDKVQPEQNYQSLALTSAVKQTSNAISGKLQGLVQEHQRVIAKTTKRGRKINSKVLHRPSCGDSRLFLNKSEKKEIDTIVEIALDNSSSMVHQHLMSTAKEAQLALALALNKINGVAVTASAFPSEYHDQNVMDLLCENESINQLAKRLTVTKGSGGCTPSASAMWHCLRKVMNSRKSKKVILFITDGHPSYGHAEPLTELVKKAERAGVVIIGIAVGSIAHNKAAFHQHFKHALFIQDIGDLKSELFSIAKDILID